MADTNNNVHEDQVNNDTDSYAGHEIDLYENFKPDELEDNKSEHSTEQILKVSWLWYDIKIAN